MSMPGTFRKTKERMFGPGKMPNDPLEPQRIELSDFEEVIVALHNTGGAVQAAVKILGGAPLPLVELLGRFYGPDDVTGKYMISRFARSVTFFAKQLEEGVPHLEAMSQLVSQVAKHEPLPRQGR